MPVPPVKNISPIPRLGRFFPRTPNILDGLSIPPWGISPSKDSLFGKRRGVYGVIIGSSFLSRRFTTGFRIGGEKIDLNEIYLPCVLKSFSGYLAVDEVYDGPLCILYAVDPKQGLRVAYEVLDHDPTEKDLDRFLKKVRTLLKEYGQVVHGITTDGSPLYPKAIAVHFPDARHQICVFHILKELNKLVLRALARFRRRLQNQLGKKGKRGRPAASQRPRIARRKRQEKYLHALFESRHLWVRKHLSDLERRRLMKLSRGHPLLKALRDLVETVTALFDRRCRTQTAKRKLSHLRKARLFQRFPELDPIRQKLAHPNLDRALEFLDDKLLEKTSNAVERSNRRHRKMQKSVYRVRTQHTIERRIKLDMMRDLNLSKRVMLVTALHHKRRAYRRQLVKEHNLWAATHRRKAG
jgi:hypothetical protein